MFYLTPQERKFICLIMIVFIMGAAVQLLLRRDIAGADFRRPGFAIAPGQRVLGVAEPGVGSGDRGQQCRNGQRNGSKFHHCLAHNLASPQPEFYSWYARRELNPQPLAPEANALSN